MISKEILEAHYLEYSNQADEWVANMGRTKKSIIEHVLKEMNYVSHSTPVKIVILGTSDKRYIPLHERIFEKTMGQKIQMLTFDLDSGHLGGESSKVISHDVTTPFPNPPYDIVFSHELMKFLTPQEQLQTIRNSYKALKMNGLALHILHEPSLKGTSELKSWQHRVNPDRLIEDLNSDHIPTTKLFFESESDVAWLRETTVIVLKKDPNINNV